MDLRERLGGYEVTVVPSGRTPLALIWSEASDDRDDDEARRPTFGALALLDDYRITRVPGRVAS